MPNSEDTTGIDELKIFSSTDEVEVARGGGPDAQETRGDSGAPRAGSNVLEINLRLIEKYRYRILFSDGTPPRDVTACLFCIGVVMPLCGTQKP